MSNCRTFTNPLMRLYDNVDPDTVAETIKLYSIVVNFSFIETHVTILHYRSLYSDTSFKSDKNMPMKGINFNETVL